MKLEFIVPIAPKGKKEARRKLNGHTYKDSETRAYMEAIAQSIRTQYQGWPLDMPLSVVYRCYRARPKSDRKSKWPATKPDFDNYAKAIGDALTGIVWVDDSRIVDGQVIKLFAEEENPRIEIIVTTLLNSIG
ncbi:MAG: RusA family crossover junction endodeoxyribonuclease [Proteobacteria bacterium]|nr:MAG: RusA family crossover junction endodeoxyribonuclease [Pseudomonadota bacterium]